MDEGRYDCRFRIEPEGGITKQRRKLIYAMAYDEATTAVIRVKDGIEVFRSADGMKALRHMIGMNDQWYVSMGDEERLGWEDVKTTHL